MAFVLLNFAIILPSKIKFPSLTIIHFWKRHFSILGYYVLYFGHYLIRFDY